MTERSATILGFAAAAAAPPILVFVRALPSETTIHTLWDAVTFFAVVFLTFLPTTALIGLIVGAPAFLLARKIGIVTWWLSILVGALAGALGAAMLFSRLVEVQVYALFGSVAGLVFWLVRRKLSNGVRRNVASESSEL